jgi:hypothetical protein
LCAHDLLVNTTFNPKYSFWQPDGWHYFAMASRHPYLTIGSPLPLTGALISKASELSLEQLTCELF